MISKGLLYLISGYQKHISPARGRVCKYYPTCSEYARQAIMVHGPFRGFFWPHGAFCAVTPFPVEVMIRCPQRLV